MVWSLHPLQWNSRKENRKSIKKATINKRTHRQEEKKIDLRESSAAKIGFLGHKNSIHTMELNLMVPMTTTMQPGKTLKTTKDISRGCGGVRLVSTLIS